MLIYLARHAWAGHYGDPPPANGSWSDDSQRPLTAEGVERYGRVVGALAERGFQPERLIASPYTRCWQTAELIAEAVGVLPEPFEGLEPGARLEPLLEWTRRIHAASVCWVGHNPDCERLLAELIGEGWASIRFAKGSVAAVRFEGPPAAGEGTLVWHATAKLLGV